MAPHRRKNIIASRRRVEEEGEDEGGLDATALDDDSLSEGSLTSEDEDDVDGSDVEDSASPELRKSVTNGHPLVVNGDVRKDTATPTKSTSDTDLMLHGLKISDQNGPVEEIQYEDMKEDLDDSIIAEPPSAVRSKAHMDQAQESPIERRRREHDEYKKKRDADPAFVPNRGAFFMHDHRHAGPAANGFRPFGRGRGRGRGGIGGPFAPVK
jgi:hypothetical protein